MPGQIMLPVNRVLGCSKTQEGLRLPSGYVTPGKCRAMTVRGMQEQIQEPSPVAELPSSLPFFFQTLKVTGRTSEGPPNCSLPRVTQVSDHNKERECTLLAAQLCAVGNTTDLCILSTCKQYRHHVLLWSYPWVTGPLPWHLSFLADPNSSFSPARCFPSPPPWRPKHPELFLG